MTQYNQRAARDVLAGERERTLAIGVRRLAASIYFTAVERAFEEAGCSCNPYRARLKELEGQYNAERQRLQDALDRSELGSEIKELKAKVQEIDYAEHPSLDAQGRQAYHFLPVWLTDQIREGNTSLLGQSQEAIAQLYANDWIGGWRPRSLRKQQNRRAKPVGG